jgi:hypothetical protein
MRSLVLAAIAMTLSGSTPVRRVLNPPVPATSPKVQDRFVPAAWDLQQIGGILGDRMNPHLPSLDTAAPAGK